MKSLLKDHHLKLASRETSGAPDCLKMQIRKRSFSRNWPGRTITLARLVGDNHIMVIDTGSQGVVWSKGQQGELYCLQTGSWRRGGSPQMTSTVHKCLM